jgi:fluoride ion exporter CrcB/FEX
MACLLIIAEVRLMMPTIPPGTLAANLIGGYVAGLALRGGRYARLILKVVSA